MKKQLESEMEASKEINNYRKINKDISLINEDLFNVNLDINVAIQLLGELNVEMTGFN
jgi:hypothetical protein